MKKMIAVAMLASIPMMAQADKDVGCGIGTQIWNGQSGLLPKILASTTNGTFGNQTFGISSGTLGCSTDGVVTAQNRAPAFVAANLDQLAVEMAAGQGESLEAYASIYGVQGEDRGAFFALTKAHYSEIFSSESTTSDQVVSTVQDLMKSDARLAAYLS